MLGCGHRHFVASSVVFSKAEFGRKSILLLTLTLLAGDNRLSPWFPACTLVPVEVGVHQAGNVVVTWRSRQQLPEGRGPGPGQELVLGAQCLDGSIVRAPQGRGHCVLGRAKQGSE